LRALAKLGVEHEPDFPVPVGAEVQLIRDESLTALQRHGHVLLMALSAAGATLTPVEAHSVLSADSAGRDAVMDHIMRMGRD
jgi:hypothetical protein